MLPYRIRFALCRVLSPVLTASRLISFPAPTKMLQFGAFPFLKRNDVYTPRGLIRQSMDQRLPAPTHRISQLGTTFIGSQAQPSPRWCSRPQNCRLDTRPGRRFHNGKRFLRASFYGVGCICSKVISRRSHTQTTTCRQAGSIS